MKVLKGKAVFSGIAIGKIFVFQKNDISAEYCRISDAEAEVHRVEEATGEAVVQLQKLYDKTLQEAGESSALIFEMHKMLIEDAGYQESIRAIIREEQANAEYAVAVTCDKYVSRFAAMDDDYMRARAADIKDISERLIRLLSGTAETQLKMSEPSIIVAKDLTPGETIQMDKSKVLAFVTEKGSSTSHTAILARTMNIPALINVRYGNRIEGLTAIVDGQNGALILDPDEATLRKYRKWKEEEEIQKSGLLEFKGKITETQSGKRVHLYANIGTAEDVASVLENDAEGIGLFRSECLYLERNSFPSEEEQFQIYKTVAQKLNGKKVMIRTLDIGADKQLDYFKLEKEENPAMGYRAIRICLDRPEIFKTQLRALFRAAVYGNISIMYPLIVSVKEVLGIKELVSEVKKELTEEGIPFKDSVEQGIMIETPAAVMISDLLAKEVDFFSIGTNDLTQYTLAADRQNESVEDVYDPHHEAILRMIRMVVENAHREGIWAGICGELGADGTLTEEFIKMGLDEISVSPALVLPMRRRIRNMD